MRGIFTLSIWNLVLVSLIGVGYSLGRIQVVFISDWTGITYILSVILFLAVLCDLLNMWRMEKGKTLRVFSASFPGVAGRSAVLLGFLGTIVGLSYLIQNIPTTGIDGDPAKLFAEVMTHVKAGLGPAFYTTLVGIVARTWIMTNQYIIDLFYDGE